MMVKSHVLFPDSDDFAGSTDVEDDSPVDTDDEIQR